MTAEPQVMREGVFNLAVCIPREWDDEQIESFANGQVPCGTRHGWRVRKQEDYEPVPATDEGAPLERVPCRDREGFDHVILDC